MITKRFYFDIFIENKISFPFSKNVLIFLPILKGRKAVAVVQVRLSQSLPSMLFHRFSVLVALIFALLVILLQATNSYAEGPSCSTQADCHTIINSACHQGRCHCKVSYALRADVCQPIHCSSAQDCLIEGALCSGGTCRCKTGSSSGAICFRDQSSTVVVIIAATICIMVLCALAYVWFCRGGDGSQPAPRRKRTPKTPNFKHDEESENGS